MNSSSTSSNPSTTLSTPTQPVNTTESETTTHAEATTFSQSVNTTSSTENTSSPTNTTMDSGAIVGIALAGVFFAVTIVVIVCIVRRFRRKIPQGSPTMLPDAYPTVNLESNLGQMSSSTTILVRTNSIDFNSGTSADELPIAPPIPSLDYEPSDSKGQQEVYMNEGRDDHPEDYVEPVTWVDHAPPDDLYMDMELPTGEHKPRDLDEPVPLSHLVFDYQNPHKPPPCVGSTGKGYVNVHGSETLPKYANMQKAEETSHMGDEEGELEDYENVPKSVSKANSGGHGNNSKAPRQKMTELSSEAVQKKTKTKYRESPKQKHKTKVKSSTTPKTVPDTSSTSSSSGVPTAKHKTWTKPSNNGDGCPDYVNVKDYSKVKPKGKGHLDLVSFNKKPE